MSEEEIMELADEAGSFSMIQFGVTNAKIEWLRKFAYLVAEKEREAIIDILDEYRLPLLVLGELKSDIRSRAGK